MGYYINENSKGESLPSRGKARALISDGAEVVDAKFQANLVCVVENGPFDATGYCYNEKEFELFNDPRDHRPKIWLMHPQAEKLAK